MTRIKYIALFLAYTLFLLAAHWLIEIRGLDNIDGVLIGAWIMVLVYYIKPMMRGKL